MTTEITPENWTDEELNIWFEKAQWREGWTTEPDNSINKRSLAIHYHKNPEQWKQAFTFLKDIDLKNLPLGKVELDGKKLFVAIDEYQSKDKNQTKFEAHKKYIDIQYIISGKEQIGLTTPDKVKVTEPYNEDKDLIFYEYKEGEYLNATPASFFVFFPEDVHRPGIKINESIQVKKAVIKIRITA